MPAPRGLLRFNASQESAHFAGRAGAVMDGSGLEASFGAGHRRIGFATKTNLARCRALRPFLSFSPGSLARAYDSSRKNQLSSTRATRRSQVSARNKIRQSATVVPPTNHHLEALDPRLSGAPGAFGLLEGDMATRKQSALQSRARHVSDPSACRAADDSQRWQTFQSRALPSVRSRQSHLPRAASGSALAFASARASARSFQDVYDARRSGAAVVFVGLDRHPGD